MSYLSAISAKEHYTLRFILRVAPSYYTKKPISLASISRAERISEKYLEQLARPFSMAGMIASKRGRNGGYVFLLSPDETSLYEIFDIDGVRENAVPCFEKNKDNDRCFLEGRCPSQKAWKKLDDALQKTMHSITLRELIQ